METLTALCRKQCMHCLILTVCPLYRFFDSNTFCDRGLQKALLYFFPFFFFFKHTYYNTSYREKDAITRVCETGI